MKEFFTVTLPMFIKHQFTEDNGNFSSMRTQANIWCYGIFINWTYACINSGSLVPIDATILGIMGMFVGGKVVQKFGEQKIDISKEIT